MTYNIKLDMKAQPWKRTRGAGNRRVMDADQKEYYYTLYRALCEAGLKPFPPAPLELGMFLKFSFKDRRWRDTDNLLKAVLDAGQPQKWALKKDRPYMPDLWDDKQFSDVYAKRVRGADENRITGYIRTLEGA